ncbi:MAG: O-antigen ligase family protein [Armatimonadetes bacterium]|nr:O-antigen ligase family protein [Armatimonadota bacterium]
MGGRKKDLGRSKRGAGIAGGRDQAGSAWPALALAGCWALLLASVPTWAGKLSAWADWTVVFLVAALALAALCAQISSSGGLPWPYWLLVSSAILSGVSFVVSVSKYDSLRLLLLFASGLWVLHFLRALAQYVSWAGWGIGAGGIITGLWGLREWAWTAAAGAPSWRPFAGFLNPNAMAGYLLVALPAAVAASLQLRTIAADKPPGHPARVAYPLAFILTVAAAGGMLLTASKGAFLGALVAAVVTVLVRGGRRRPLLLATVALLAGASLALPSLRARALAAVAAEKGTSVAFRAKTWAGTLDMARARPWLGWGPGSFRHAYPQFAHVAFTQMAHNSWLQWWAESGVFSAATLLAGLVGLIAVLARFSGEWPTAAIFALTGLLVHNLVDYTWYMAPPMLSALALAGVALGMPMAHGARDVSGEDASRRSGFAALGISVALAVGGLAAWFLSAERLAVAADAAWAAGLTARGADMARAAARRAGFSGDLWVKVGKMEEGRAGVPPSREHLRAAVQAYETAARWYPTDPAGYIGAARCLRLAGETDQAVQWGRKAAEVYPRGPVALVEYARCLEAADRTREALDIYRRAMALADGDYGRIVPLSGWADYHLAIAAAAVARSQAIADEELGAWRVAGRVLAEYLQWSAAYAPALLTAGRADPGLKSELQSLAREAAAALRHSHEPGDRQLATRLAGLGGT